MPLPGDKRDWVPANDLVYFAFSAAESMELKPVRVKARGSGQPEDQELPGEIG